MARNRDYSGFSDLEQEFELEMEDDQDVREAESMDEEFEAPEEELDDRSDESSDYAERLYELSLREYESESEADSAVNEVLNEIEQDFFFKKLRKGWSKFKKGALGKLVNKGLKLAGGQIPGLQALKGITSLARGDLKGMLGSLVKAGVSSAIPGGGVALDALKTLGFKETEQPEDNRDAWENVVDVAREAYDHLASNMTERADDPLEATRLATDAFKAGLRRQGGSARQGGRERRRRRIRLRRGDVLVIECE
jgi:hypothetical protein